MNEEAPVGKTKDAGWEIGVRRTLPISVEEAWELLVTQPGMGYWLGNDAELCFEKGSAFHTEEGNVGKIKSYAEGKLIRLSWQPRDWTFPSTLQVRVIPSKTKATISFHQERLTDGEQRERMRAHWTEVLDQLSNLVRG